MADLATLTIGEMAESAKALRKIGQGAVSMEDVATRVVRYFYDQFTARATGARAFALVRLFKTHPYEAMDDELRGFADRMLQGHAAPPKMKCLTLLGTVGDQAAWNARRDSTGHQAIPLPSREFIEQAPMIARLTQQLGVDPSLLLNPESGLLMDAHERTFNVFYVPEAGGSQHIPAQKEFVRPMGIRSAIGCGGLLPSMDLFAVVLFSKIVIPLETAELFKPLALAVKVALLPFEETVFDAASRPD